jgi:transcriptional regulator with GAF, ATPase, and Fis domain
MNDQARIRVFSVDGDPLLKERIAAIINHQPDMQLEAQANSGSDPKDSDFEHRLLTPDGALKRLQVVAHAVHNVATCGTEYVDAVMDVSAARELRQALENAYVEIQGLKDQLQRENIVLREEIDKTSMFEEIVGSSPPLRTVLSHMSKIAPTDSTVLITGETGTGKELVARAIHKRSQRSSRAFVRIRFGQRHRDQGIPGRQASLPRGRHHCRIALPIRPLCREQQSFWP